ncbi:class I adenylate-forming enzyme family protein [Mycolicibacterium arseniciresistens]|uniref:Class I adenylate-forming enzyme family protein n=1 Tax=Mycolicibacterium arseniciresistens TaxID=3062257 RepID=A0ABT8UEZ9_9MYCO|nr:class I adenylate-forming enzyme family protein [Mycolicibacterium arseniciresistens]MDO3635652.1 class I adenylate-forming enzyme family protein [Mycolicibacterium arseniciresistens]
MTRTIDRVLRGHAADHPARPAVIDPTTRLTYAELDFETAELAAELILAGVTKGTRVGLIMPNSVRWVVVATALTRVGAVLVPLSTLLSAPELLAQLRTAAVRLLLTVEEFRGHRYLDGLRAAAGLPDDVGGPLRSPELPALRRIWIIDRLHDAVGDATGRAQSMVAAMAGAVEPSDPLAILFTSGSSGAPKAVIHSHGNALAAARSGLTARCIGADTRLYLPMPFFWVGGFGSGVISALVAGATLVTEQIPRPETTMALLERERVTLFRGWPEQAEALARASAVGQADLSALRPGSLEALLAPELRAEPGARARLFGMTESFGPYSGYPADTDMPRPQWGSCGRPFDGMTVRIADPSTGAAVPDGTTGVIQIRGPHIMRGMCRRSREELFTPDGWYSTGDLGHLDDAGFLFYHGRVDDMFKVSGATVYPAEVERALRAVDGVQLAVVTNVLDDRVGAAVVCDPATMTVGRLTAAVRKSLSAFKVPTVWVLLDSDDAVPRLASGKVDVRGLRTLLESEADT